MNWIILIVAGFFESGFAFCLGKMKEVSGTEWYLWGAGFLVKNGLITEDMFREMRRKRQLLPTEECVAILERMTNGTLALYGDDGYPYAAPRFSLFCIKKQ